MKCVVMLLIVSVLAIVGCGTQQVNEEDLVAKSIGEINADCILVEEKEGEAEGEDTEEVALTVEMPDYEKLMIEAYQTDDPETYMKEALSSGDYETKKFDTTAQVTAEDGKRVVHEEEAVDQLLEEEIIKAMNTLTEEQEK